MTSLSSLPASRGPWRPSPAHSDPRELSLISGHFSLPLALQERSYLVAAPSLGFLCLWDFPPPQTSWLFTFHSLGSPLGGLAGACPQPQDSDCHLCVCLSA